MHANVHKGGPIRSTHAPTSVALRTCCPAASQTGDRVTVRAKIRFLRSLSRVEATCFQRLGLRASGRSDRLLLRSSSKDQSG